MCVCVASLLHVRLWYECGVSFTTEQSNDYRQHNHSTLSSSFQYQNIKIHRAHVRSIEQKNILNNTRKQVNYLRERKKIKSKNLQVKNCLLR